MNWFDEWLEKYLETFALDARADISLKRQLEFWEPAIGHASKSELDSVTAWLVQNPDAFTKSQARFIGKAAMHLDTIKTRLRDMRAVNLETRRDDLDNRLGTCERCGGSGFVVVPHIRAVREGDWKPMHVARGGPSFYTQAVCCSCAKGRWVHENTEPKSMTLERYATLNPRWEIQINRRASEQNAFAAATGGESGREQVERFAEILAERARQTEIVF
jgi:hypothetical protein